MEIKASELRIGNYVDYYKNGQVSKIKALEFGYCHLSDASSIEYNLLSGVPLSEEILLNCGFEEVDFAGGCYEKEYLTIDTSDFNCCYKRDWLEIKIKYLHQLQNLFYILTNQELEINL